MELSHERAPKGTMSELFVPDTDREASSGVCLAEGLSPSAWLTVAFGYVGKIQTQ
ncbi:rCG46504 [Rattus norvegicus]|uniref:RCG46504 n=1 Tax=Rattus norvegicus TaxID=10116 RepID=A6ID89_RAT|nr:rCG46504 [Rattus norvegicus]